MQPPAPDNASTLLIACGALAREVRQLRHQQGLNHLDPHYLPASLHNHPTDISQRVAAFVDRYLLEHPDCRAVIVGYGDCGTGGQLDRTIDELRLRWRLPIERLPGAHCYQFFAGHERFEKLAERQPATFYLTDFLARHLDALVWQAYRLDRHPELIEMLFGNYRFVRYLTQADPPDADVVYAARRFADRIGCEFVIEPVGLGPFAAALAEAS